MEKRGRDRQLEGSDKPPKGPRDRGEVELELSRNRDSVASVPVRVIAFEAPRPVEYVRTGPGSREASIETGSWLSSRTNSFMSQANHNAWSATCAPRANLDKWLALEFVVGRVGDPSGRGSCGSLPGLLLPSTL